MERRDAERVFSLVAEIGGDLRGRIVSERWGLVWIVLGLGARLKYTPRTSPSLATQRRLCARRLKRGYGKVCG